jgi:non-specific serine/threonine protein kinase/serine/threonine-protein kinase
MLVGKRPCLPELTQPSRTIWGTPVTYQSSVYFGELLTLNRMPESIPADLASIILMALREDPDRRYSSAGEMRRDIERFMDGQVVLAHPSRFPYQAIKFTLRHKFPIVAVALIIASLAGGVATTAAEAHLADAQRLLAEERAQEADRERKLAEAKTVEAERSREVAQQQSKIAAQKSLEAEHERVRALEQRDLTMKLATTLAVDLDTSIAPLAGSVPARRLMVSKAIEALEKLYQSSPEDPKVLVELAGAYQSLGLIQRRRFDSSLGDSEGALKSYQRSLEFTRTADRILTATPGLNSRGVSPDAVAAAYAGAYFGFGDLSTINGKHSEALEFYLKSVPYAERAAKANPPTLARARLVLPAYKKTGDMYRMLERLDEAEAYFLKAAQAGDALASMFPGNDAVAGDRMVSSFSLGQLLESRDNQAGALVQYENAAKVAEQALAANPADSKVKRNLFVFYSRTGMMKYELERYPEAQADYDKALVIAEERFKSENGNLQAVYDLADVHYRIFQTLDATGRREDARNHLNSSADLTHRAARIDPNSEQTKQSLERVEQALEKLNSGSKVK